jgi:hypothetical protein
VKYLEWKLSIVRRGILGLFGLCLTVSSALCAASPKTQAAEGRVVERIKTKISHLKNEVETLKLSVAALDQQQANLSTELKTSEREFTRRFERILVPLLHWPALSSLTRSTSWIEREHLKFMLSQTRHRIISEPLQLISDRELRLSQSESLKSELAAKLKSLESKESLLDLQLEELRILERNSRKKAIRAPALEESH